MIIPAGFPLRYAQKGSIMAPKIYDKDGVERDLAWLTGKYGRVELKYSNKTPNWDLVAVHETEGPALMKCLALDENNIPAYVLAILTWPDLSNPSSDLRLLTGGDPAKSPWSSRGAPQFTDGQTGYTGWGLGTSSWIKDFNAGGPYHVWLYDKNTYSDCASWLGWLGGTNHMGPCYLTFKKRVSDVIVPPVDPGGGGGTGDYADVLNAIAAMDAKLSALMRHLGAA